MQINPITSRLPLQNPSFLRVKAKIKSLWQAHQYRRGARLMWKKSYQESAPLMQRKGHRKKGTKKKGKAGSSGVDEPIPCRIIRGRRVHFLNAHKKGMKLLWSRWMKPRENTGKISRSFPWMPLLCLETSSRTLGKASNEHPF